MLSADKHLINTGVLAQSPAQFSSLWALREGVTEAISKEGKPYKYDISVPLSSFKEVVDRVRDHLDKKGLIGDHAVQHVIGYGHVGDGKLLMFETSAILSHLPGNLHLNVVAKAYTPEIQSALEPFVYELVGMYFVLNLFLVHNSFSWPFSALQGICVCRTWNWGNENACSSLLQE